MANGNHDVEKQILKEELSSTRERLKNLIEDVQSKKDEAEEENDTASAALFDNLISQYARALQKTFEEQLEKLDNSAEIKEIIESLKKTNGEINGTLKKLEKIAKYAQWAKQASDVLDDLIQAAAAFAP